MVFRAFRLWPHLFDDFPQIQGGQQIFDLALSVGLPESAGDFHGAEREITFFRKRTFRSWQVGGLGQVSRPCIK